MRIEEKIEEVLKHRQAVYIFRDEEDGTWFVDGVDHPSEPLPRPARQYFSHYLDGALDGLIRLLINERMGV